MNQPGTSEQGNNQHAASAGATLALNGSKRDHSAERFIRRDTVGS